MAKASFELIFDSYKMITSKVRHMVFKPLKPVPFQFIPGQFITFHFEVDGEELNRSYSIASIPNNANESPIIEIAMSPFPGGPGTEFLCHLKPGDKVKTTGPFGRLILREEHPKRYIFVATGTGITPYRSMLPALHKHLQNQNLEVIILEGVQTKQDLLYGDDFWEFANKHPNLHFHAYYSRENPIENASYEHRGYVQDYFKTLTLNPAEDVFYLCGNPAMIDDSFNYLMDKGFTVASIRREKYISPKKRVKSK